MANKYSNLGDLFKAIANAIRSKTGSTDTIVADDFPAAIEGISSGGSSGVEYVCYEYDPQKTYEEINDGYMVFVIKLSDDEIKTDDGYIGVVVEAEGDRTLKPLIVPPYSNASDFLAAFLNSWQDPVPDVYCFSNDSPSKASYRIPSDGIWIRADLFNYSPGRLIFFKDFLPPVE